MELEELKTIWNTQKEDEKMKYNKEELLVMLDEKISSFENRVRSRDRRELIAAAFVIVIFGAWFFLANSIWTQAGCAVLVLASVFISYRLKFNQPKSSTDSHTYSHSIQQHLRAELGKVNTQKQLLKSVAWWYLLPIYIGQVFIAMGFSMPDIFKAGFILIVTALFYYIWYMYQQAVKENLNPLIEDINESIEFLKSS